MAALLAGLARLDARPGLAALRPLRLGPGARPARRLERPPRPAFELVFHFNRQARQANKIVPCKWAGTPNKGSGLRAADGEVKEYQHIGLPVQEIADPRQRAADHPPQGPRHRDGAPGGVPGGAAGVPDARLHGRGRGGVRAVRRLRHHHPGRPAHRAAGPRDRAGAGLCRPGRRAVADAASRSAGDAGRRWPRLRRRGRGASGGTADAA